MCSPCAHLKACLPRRCSWVVLPRRLLRSFVCPAGLRVGERFCWAAQASCALVYLPPVGLQGMCSRSPGFAHRPLPNSSAPSGRGALVSSGSYDGSWAWHEQRKLIVGVSFLWAGHPCRRCLPKASGAGKAQQEDRRAQEGSKLLGRRAASSPQQRARARSAGGTSSTPTTRTTRRTRLAILFFALPPPVPPRPMGFR